MEAITNVELIGHRGAPREYEENTLASFETAFVRGADGIELDVHATADGVVVVHHDPALSRRVMPSSARGRRIADSTWAELGAVTLAPESGSAIPRLEDVLAIVPPQATVYVELKDSAVEELVADVIKRSNRRCAVHSFDHRAIERIGRIAPDIPRGLLFDQYPAALRAAMTALAAGDVWLERRLIDRALVSETHDAGGRVFAWTVNEPSEAKRLAELGVDAICSDDVRPLSSLRG